MRQLQMDGRIPRHQKYPDFRFQKTEANTLNEFVKHGL